jgi:hypothetical protein
MDKLTQQLGEALDALHDAHQFPTLYGKAAVADIDYRAQKALRAYHDAQRDEREGRRADSTHILPLVISNLEDVARVLSNMTPTPGDGSGQIIKIRYCRNAVDTAVKHLKMLEGNNA